MIRRPPRSTLFPYTNALPIAEVEVFRRLVSEPEFGFPHGQPGDHLSTFAVNSEQLRSSERRLIEFDRFRPASNREHWSYSGLPIPGALRAIAHRKSPPWRAAMPDDGYYNLYRDRICLVAGCA